MSTSSSAPEIATSSNRQFFLFPSSTLRGKSTLKGATRSFGTSSSRCTTVRRSSCGAFARARRAGGSDSGMKGNEARYAARQITMRRYGARGPSAVKRKRADPARWCSREGREERQGWSGGVGAEAQQKRALQRTE